MHVIELDRYIQHAIYCVISFYFMAFKKKFEVDTFFVIIDKLISELNRRLNSYYLFLTQFKFLVNFKTVNDPDIDSLNNSIQFYIMISMIT
jgi:hypothetical protein